MKSIFMRGLSLLLVALITLGVLAFPGNVYAEQSSEIVRYSVLVLDLSPSMSDVSLNQMKKAAQKFISQVLDANGQNYVAVIPYSQSAEIYCDFTDDPEKLKNAINNVTNIYRNGTNTYDGMLKAQGILSSGKIPSNAIKNLILMTDGMPNQQYSTSDGPYTIEDCDLYEANDYSYKYANAVYNLAQEIKKDINIYTLGFFQDFTYFYPKELLGFARRFLQDIQNKGYYDIDNAEEFEFVFEEIADDIIKKRTGLFRFSSKNSINEDYVATYFYDDDYFSQGASIYNPSLATMSLCLELSAWASNVGGTKDYTDKARNARELFGEIGFKDFETNKYFTVKPSEDSIGVVAAHKDIKVNGKNYTVIALAARGGGYEAEWAGNFTAGTTGQHKGFKTASDEAYRFLSDYITRHKGEFKENIKLWLVGYSRAGATVNLLAGRLTDEGEIAGIRFDKENLYAYCFEPAMGALMSQVQPVSKYTNIHNIVNQNDLVTKVAPSAWGFTRYGVDERVIPTKLTSSNSELFAKMLEKFKELDTEWVRESIVGDKHIVDTFQGKKINPDISVDFGHWEKRTGIFGIEYWVWVPNFEVDVRLIENDNITMAQFLDELILSLATGIKNRENYAEKLQGAVRLAAAEFMGGHYESYKWDKAIKKFEEKLDAHIYDIAVEYLWGGIDGVADLITEYFVESLSEAGIDLNAYGQIPTAIKEAIAVIARTIVASVKLNGGDDLITLFSEGNASKLFAAHYPELCLAWLQIQDVNYTPEGRRLFIIDCYRKIYINCPVDVNVYNSKGELVAQFIDDEPQEIDGSTIVARFNSNKEKIVYLPADDTFSIEIIATDDGELNYSVCEFSQDTGTYAKIVNYYDVPIAKGDILNAVVPKFSDEDAANTGEGSGVNYSLANSTGELTPLMEVSGQSARDSVYIVNVTSDNSEGGTVIGGGVYSAGSFAQVSAIEYEKCDFAGWYKNGVLVSTDKSYRFRVEEDTYLTAKFEGSRPSPNTASTYELKIEAGTGGRITKGANGYYGNGSITPLEAIPDDGYRFKNWVSSKGGVFGDKNSETTTFTMPGNETVVMAVFEPVSSSTPSPSSSSSSSAPLKYSITATSGAGGTVTGGGKYNSGSTITLTAVPDTNYIFDGWYENNIKIDNAGEKYSFVVAENRTIEARFVHVPPSDDGILLNDNKVNLTLNEDGSVTITPDVLEGLTAPVLLYLPYENGSINHVGVLKKDEGDVIIPFSIYKDGKMIILVSEPGTYGVIENKKTFTDIEGHWASETIDFITSRTLFYGVGDNIFDTETGMTRAMFVTVLSKLDGADLSGYNTSAFSDINVNSWYCKAVAWAVDIGIVSGYSKELFGPNDLITAEQIAIVLDKYMKYKGIILKKDSDNVFVHDEEVSPWAKDTVMDMCQYGLIFYPGSGKYTYTDLHANSIAENSIVSPKKAVNRAGVAQILRDFIEAYLK
ncbi:InlB B-repeat-containing protein [Acetivibrio straminisolvens]|jgi:hypothetical protein|uniref:InlB B-repeat-containing protein n=1 Tax=Acetivibrio straminisolvens TaxID=253314 RepID=UPI00224006D8|nr:VWA domain-containing protein [Acetivibrio straminisolvens]